MNTRSATWGLCLGLALVYAAPVEAQVRLFRDRRRESSRVSPIREQAKREAEQAYQRGQYERAVELTTTVLRQDPRDHVAYYLRGSARVEMGRAQSDAKLVREGVADARQAISIAGPKSVDYFLPYLYGMTNLAAIEDRKEHAEVAVKVAGELISRPGLKPEEKANLLYQRAMSHVSLRDFDAAIADYERAIQSQRTHLGAYVALADAYDTAGKHEEALSAFGKAIDAFPSNPLVYNNRGMYLERQGKRDEALVDFTRALELDDKYSYAYTNRGYALMQLGDPQAAESDFTASLKLDENQPMVYSLRGSSLLDQGKLEEAMADFRHVVELDSRNAVARADLGFAEFFDKDYAGALASFDRAVQLDSSLRYVHPWQFLAMESAGQADDARKKFAASADKEAKQRDWVGNLLAYLAGGLSEKDLIEAITSSNEETRDAQLCEAHFFVGQRKSREGKGEAAAEHFRQVLKTNASHLSAYRGARFALKKFNVTNGDVKTLDVSK